MSPLHPLNASRRIVVTELQPNFLHPLNALTYYNNKSDIGIINNISCRYKLDFFKVVVDSLFLFKLVDMFTEVNF